MQHKSFKGSAPCKLISSDTKKFKPSGTSISPDWTSNNWSGYARNKSKKNAFHSISGYWVVPKVAPAKKNTYSSAWIGIDGFHNKSLIQIGTEQDHENGSCVYYAWWEILPAAEKRIPYPVSSGDRMYAKINKLSGNKWSMLLRNLTKKWRFRIVRTYNGPAASAEWIMEAAAFDGRTGPLANYGKMTFYNLRVNNRNPLLKRSERGIMIQNDKTVSTPSLPNKARNAFTVAYG
ncbi:G1 family glutamic endopeptidase [Ferviditalea candida]|uniref:G1 family glutamic endopeptidase n=1 Tax=Ferviditalea candida TaxID=3108399 RepID=A0ABU5ZD35_9BACL|nr:G1 family glutamic endopeptidase [Paenibacillaceae bacterium T2]